MAGIHDFTVAEAMNVQLGRVGSEYIGDTAVHSASYCDFIALTACVINTYSGSCSGLAGKTIPAGMGVSGPFTSISLTSGTMIAYKEA